MDTKFKMKMAQCPHCGGSRFEEKRVNYLYSHGGKYLLMPNTPAEVCETCGAEFYPANVVKEIERRFFAIHAKEESPDQILQIPSKAFT